LKSEARQPSDAAAPPVGVSHRPCRFTHERSEAIQRNIRENNALCEESSLDCFAHARNDAAPVGRNVDRWSARWRFVDTMDTVDRVDESGGNTG
jgi:hypothetical protein